MVHFNDWLHPSHADNPPHAVQAPPYVGFLVPVQNSFLKRSGIMQVYGFAAGSHYTCGPYKAIGELLICIFCGFIRTAWVIPLQTFNTQCRSSTTPVGSRHRSLSHI